MSGDRTYETLSHEPAEIVHRYGPSVHLLSNPLALTLLSKLSARGTIQPEVNRLLAALYRMLTAEAVAAEFPRRRVEVPTRMIERTGKGIWRGEAVDPETPTAVVAIARGGILPAQIVFDFLHLFLDPLRVRQDHLALGRTVDGSGKVTGADLGSAKIGGSVEGAMVLVPDPMGATGSTLARVLDHYAENHGHPVRTIALNLIVTPEYLRRLRKTHPETVIYAFRLDRGLSAPDVLGTVPGERWDDERGLDEHDYIVPGAGGLGEVITNSWV